MYTYVCCSSVKPWRSEAEFWCSSACWCRISRPWSRTCIRSAWTTVTKETLKVTSSQEVTFTATVTLQVKISITLQESAAQSLCPLQCSSSQDYYGSVSLQNFREAIAVLFVHLWDKQMYRSVIFSKRMPNNVTTIVFHGLDATTDK